MVTIDMINNAESQSDLSQLEEKLWLSYAGETYADTADRLEAMGYEQCAELYRALENRWWELER